jgi:hypothetical protein
MLLALSHFDTTFSTRPRGEELRLRVEAAVKAGDPVTIDLSGVLAISYSFADEFAGCWHSMLRPHLRHGP